MGDEVVETSFGKFLVNPRDCIGTTTKAGRLWDGAGFLQPVAVEYGRLGDWGTTILDVGANIGTFSVWLAHQHAWRVVAVEPVRQTMNYLKANLDLNYAWCGDRVIPLECAAVARRCRLRAVDLDLDNLGGTALVEDPAGDIQGEALDDWSHLWMNGLSLVKIDAQGSDFAALQGLEDSLHTWHPPIVFEWEAGLAERAWGHDLGECVAWLDARGYVVSPWPAYANNYLARWHGEER